MLALLLRSLILEAVSILHHDGDRGDAEDDDGNHEHQDSGGESGDHDVDTLKVKVCLYL